jgi:hypothetical protein
MTARQFIATVAIAALLTHFAASVAIVASVCWRGRVVDADFEVINEENES